MKFNFIQIFRGLAAISVMLFHLDADSEMFLNHVLFNFEYGYLGVDFFFVLSGFIITFIHLRDIEGGTNLKGFILKRSIRIFPLYWLVLMLTVLSFSSYPFKPWLNENWNTHSVEGWILIIKNVILFPLTTGEMPVGVAWTLSYELVFYGLFAIAILFGLRFTRIALVLWIILIVIYSRDVIPRTTFLNVVIGGLNLEFVCGCIAAYIFIKTKHKLSIINLTICMVFVLTLFIVYLHLREFNRESLVVNCLLGAGASLIVLMGLLVEIKVNKFPKILFPLIWIGNASYALYLTHSYFNALFLKLLTTNNYIESSMIWERNTIILLVAFGSIIISLIIHNAIERPILAIAKKWIKV